MAGAVSTPLCFGHTLFSYYYWRDKVRYQFYNQRQEVPVVVKISKEATSNGWKLSKPCAATGTHTVRKMVDCYSGSMLLSEKPDFSTKLNCTGTPLSVINVISGYWMGPDDEDECGYVQASVQRIK